MHTREQDTEAFIAAIRAEMATPLSAEAESWIRNELSRLSAEEFNHTKEAIQNHYFSNQIVTRHLNSNQMIWGIYTNSIIRQIAKNLTAGDHSLMSLITYLGMKRHHIANLLGHGNNQVERDEYGKLRGIETSEHELCMELLDDEASTAYGYLLKPLLSQPLLQNYVELTKYIFDRSFLEPLKRERKHYLPHVIPDFIKMHTARYTDRGRPYKPNFEYYTNLSSLSPETASEFGVHLFVETKSHGGKKCYLSFTYPMLNKITYAKKITELQDLFNDILKFDAKSDPRTFMRLLGILNFRLYKLLPLRRGSASLVEQLTYGIAEYKNIILGKALKNDVPLDFKAFVSKEREYADWFFTNGYENIRRATFAATLKSMKFYLEEYGSYFLPASRARLQGMLDGFKEECDPLTSDNNILVKLFIDHAVDFLQKQSAGMNFFSRLTNNLQKPLDGLQGLFDSDNYPLHFWSVSKEGEDNKPNITEPRP